MPGRRLTLVEAGGPLGLPAWSLRRRRAARPLEAATDEAGVEVYIAAADLVPQIASPIDCVTDSERRLAGRDKLEQSLAFAEGLAALLVPALLV